MIKITTTLHKFVLLCALGTLAACAGDTIVYDQSPNPITFVPQVSTQKGASSVSNTVTIKGINTSTAISISNGEYSINGGRFIFSPSYVESGDKVEVKILVPENATHLQQYQAEVVIGDLDTKFTVTYRTTNQAPSWPQIEEYQNATPLLSGGQFKGFAHIADLNNDGLNDIVTGAVGFFSGNLLNVGFYKNIGTTNQAIFQYQYIHEIDHLFGSQSAVGDINNDGYKDIVIGGGSNQALYVFYNNGDEQPTFTQHWASNSLIGGTHIHLADIDGDNDVDIIPSPWPRISQYFQWVENTSLDESNRSSPGRNSFEEHLIPILGEADSDVIDTIVNSQTDSADFNNDGHLDIIQTHALTNSITWFENLGVAPLEFRQHTISEQVRRITAHALMDVDGDGDIDIVSQARDGDSPLAWYENIMSESTLFAKIPSGFKEHSINTTLNDLNAIALVDMDNDGDEDFVAVGQAITWYEYDLKHNDYWVEHLVTNDSQGTRYINAIDLDGDKMPELIGGGIYDDTIYWWHQAPPQDIAVTTPSSAFRLPPVTDAENDHLHYTISGGADRRLFALNSKTGHLHFLNPPLSGEAIDHDKDGVYQIKVSVSDGDGKDSRLFRIQIR